MDSPIALFLDFDGTLVEIAPRPDEVRVDPGLVPTLEALHARLGGALAVVTGRPVAVIDDFLAPARFDCAGLHGAERRVDGVLTGGTEADHPELRARMPRLAAMLAGLEGVLIEDKGASVAIHWRLAPPDAARQAEAAVTEIAAELAGGYRVQLGKAVGEIVPAAATKAQAIRALMQGAPYAGRRAVFLGDDRTDEIAFAGVAEIGGVGIRIGHGKTAAARRLPDPASVRTLLGRWAAGGLIDPDALPAA